MIFLPDGFQNGRIDPNSVFPDLGEYEANRVRAAREAVRVWLDQERAMNVGFEPVRRGLADA